MVEMNKPPITLNPFSVQPVGQAFFAGYGAYLAWQILRPPSEAEVEADNKRAALGAVAAEAAAPFLNAAAEAPGAIKTDSGLVYEELQPGEGASPSLDQKVKVHYVGVRSPTNRGLPNRRVPSKACALWQARCRMGPSSTPPAPVASRPSSC